MPRDWNMLAVMVRDGERVVDHRMCLVPRSDYEIVDDWHVARHAQHRLQVGPRHRMCSSPSTGRSPCTWRAAAASFPGARVNPNPLYQVPLSALGSHCLAAAGVGNAQAALELTIEAITRAQHELHRRCACATSRPCSCASPAPAPWSTRRGCVIRADCLEAERIAHEGRAPTLEEKLRFKRNVAYAMELCTEAVDTLHALAGANGIYDRYPIQRLFRDQHALAGHIGFSWDAQGAPWALVAIGGEFSSPTM